MKEFDAIIVGSGPAGSLAALVLARAGKRVALIDKARFPRPKVCGDCVNPSCWPIWERHGLAERFAELPHQSLRGISLELNQKVIFKHNFVLSERGERAVEREVLDNWLCHEAQEAGAHLFHGVRVDGADVKGEVKTTQGLFKGRYVIGADGRNSIVSRLSGLATYRQTCTRVAWQANIEPDELDHYVHMHIFNEGYYGMTRTSEKTANLCLVLGSKANATPQKIANRYFPKLPAQVWHSIYPISRRAADLGRGRILLAGDAARVVEPFTGEGIYFALSSGEAAAHAILKGLEANDETVAQAAYSDAHRALYKKRARVNTFTNWCARRPTRAVRVLGLLQYWPSSIATMLNQVHHAHQATTPRAVASV